MQTDSTIKPSENRGLATNIYLKTATPYALWLCGAAFILALLLTIIIETGWRWALNLFYIFIVLSVIPFALLVQSYFKTIQYIEKQIVEWQSDAKHRREIESQQVNILITGRVKNVNVNSTVDERRVLMRTNPQEWRMKPLDEAYKIVDAPLAVPALEPPKDVTLEARNLEWMITQMLTHGELTRTFWLKQSFPDAQPVTRGIYDAVMVALQETGYLVERKQPKPGRFTTSDVGLVLNALAEKYPDGLVIRETIGRA